MEAPIDSPAHVLARAFHDDPMFTFVEPDQRRRSRVLPWFFSAALRLGRRNGRVDVDAGRGAAIWLRPGASLGPAQLVRSGLALAPVRLGPRAFRRFARLTAAFETAGERWHGPRYWHLFILGVDPAHHGTGVGGRLIAPVLADTAGDPCYLETLNAANLPFYERPGFTVAGHVTEPGLPEFWSMLRAPR